MQASEGSPVVYIVDWLLLTAVVTGCVVLVAGIALVNIFVRRR